MTGELRRALRLEQAVLCAAAAVLLCAHMGEVRWLRFAVAFVAVDAIGFLPGVLAGRAVRRVHYALYNVTHSYACAAAVVSLWALASGFEWAMLALPLHLAGDRGLLGNFHKSPTEKFA
jgi:hypothetical protein